MVVLDCVASLRSNVVGLTPTGCHGFPSYLSGGQRLRAARAAKHTKWKQHHPEPNVAKHHRFLWECQPQTSILSLTLPLLRPRREVGTRVSRCPASPKTSRLWVINRYDPQVTCEHHLEVGVLVGLEHNN